MDSKELVKTIAEYTLEKKAEDVVILDLKKITTVTDYFLICSADSEHQVKAISDNIIEKLKEKNINIWRTEGFESSNWVILDLVDIVIHIFKPDAREFYSLEKLWGDAEIMKVEDK
ncbi:ribosome silencing factor [candidate division KSB1 bacterium 4572_119]|nr:MAG: ribosome silencing factor [candidate division KSB1 bacterium 4572_119]